MRTLAITACAFFGLTLTPALSQAHSLAQDSSSTASKTKSKSRTETGSGSHVATSASGQAALGAKDQTRTTGDGTNPSSGHKVDLNTGSQTELESLPGVGPATAEKIIAGRPYSSTADLSKAGVPAKTISGLSGMVTVGASGSASKSQSSMDSKLARPGASSGTAQASGPGIVWVNPDTKVFHRYGSRWYGKTKTGQYMTEADALKAGYRESKQSGASK
ncbi:MAG: helix-hairpin-helix domain-containing protein [Acidobacteriaceae bacterium]|nr:helix-hairpin-helix domain-containing protein [Acidobacteriaceae bacterium]